MDKHTHNASLYGPKTETNDKLSRLCCREENQKVLFAEQRVVNSAFHSVPLSAAERPVTPGCECTQAKTDYRSQVPGDKTVRALQHKWTETEENNQSALKADWKTQTLCRVQSSHSLFLKRYFSCIVHER